MFSRNLISNAFTRVMLDAHQWLGILFGALVWLICVSGTLSVLIDEFAQWEAPTAPHIERTDNALLANVSITAFAEARAHHADHDLLILAPTPELPWLRIFAFGEHEGTSEPIRREWIADAEGALHPMPHTPWTTFLRDHHERLHLPSPYGTWIVGIIGTALLASLLSGLLAHRRIFRDAFRLRIGGSRRLTHADLHNRIGVWALPFHLIVTLTGSLLGLSGLIVMLLAFAAYQGDQDKAISALLGPQPGSDMTVAPLPEIMPMLREIERLTPGTAITSISYQHVGTAGQTVSIGTAEPRHLTRNEIWTFDGTGRFLAKAGLTDGTIGMRIYGMIHPLHFGNYGGLALKLIYVVLGIGMCIIVATGPLMWLARRRSQGRPLPRVERLWSALLAGQIAAYAAAALAAMAISTAGPLLPLTIYWTMTVGSALASLLARDGVQTGRLLLILGGILLCMLPLFHIGYSPPQMVAANVINGALLCSGIVLSLIGFRQLPLKSPERSQ